jgi:CheY-like chemotaxis protein
MVDDDHGTSDAMQRLLNRMGYDVRTADSVTSALQACAKESFDILISDIGLPDGTGYDLMRQLLAQGRSAMKGIAVSGFAMDDDVKQSMDAGFHQHMRKPVNFERLQRLLEQLEPA